MRACAPLQVGETALHWAANYGNAACLQPLIDGGADPNMQDKVRARLQLSSKPFRTDEGRSKQQPTLAVSPRHLQLSPLDPWLSPVSPLAISP